MAYRMAKIFSFILGALLLALQGVDGGAITEKIPWLRTGRFLQANPSTGVSVGQCVDPGISGQLNVRTSLSSSSAAVNNATSTNPATAGVSYPCLKNLGYDQTPSLVCLECGRLCDNDLDQSASVCTQVKDVITCSAECCSACELSSGGAGVCCAGLSQGVECYHDKCFAGNLPLYKPLRDRIDTRFFCSVTVDTTIFALYELLLGEKDAVAQGVLHHTQQDGSRWTDSSQGGWNDPHADVDGLFTAGIKTTIFSPVVGPFTCEGNPALADAGFGIEWHSDDGINYESAPVNCRITCFGQAPTVDHYCRLFACSPAPTPACGEMVEYEASEHVSVSANYEVKCYDQEWEGHDHSRSPSSDDVPRKVGEKWSVVGGRIRKVSVRDMDKAAFEALQPDADVRIVMLLNNYPIYVAQRHTENGRAILRWELQMPGGKAGEWYARARKKNDDTVELYHFGA